MLLLWFTDIDILLTFETKIEYFFIYPQKTIRPHPLANTYSGSYWYPNLLQSSNLFVWNCTVLRYYGLWDSLLILMTLSVCYSHLEDNRAWIIFRIQNKAVLEIIVISLQLVDCNRWCVAVLQLITIICYHSPNISILLKSV